MSLRDGTKKMSKSEDSDYSRINLKDSADEINKKIKKAKSDSDEIPDNLKNLYKTVWEMKQKAIIDQAIGRGPFICQTQSMNLFFEEPNQNTLSSAFFYGWKNGLKTGCYYIRTRPKAQAQQFTLSAKKVQNNQEKKEQEVEAQTQVNKGNDSNYKECEMCSG